MATESTSGEARKVLKLLEQTGLLLIQDRALPNLAQTVVGRSIRGSWWGHPARHKIFRVLNEVVEDRNVYLAPLLNKKRTFIHREHWPSLLSIGSAREAWQVDALTPAASQLLARVDDGERVLASGSAVKTLEIALLVASVEVHTDTGAHAKVLMSWRAFARAHGLRKRTPSVATARAALEAAAQRYVGESGARARLPWQ